MLTLVLVLTLSQADVPVAAPALTPPPPPPVLVDEPAPAAEFKPTAPRKARLFSEPPVAPGTLWGRVGVGTLTTIAGAALGAGFVFLGVLFSFAFGGIVPGIISGVFAALSVATGSALGAATLGKSYGRDFVDAFLVALGASLVSAACVVGAFFWFAATVPLFIIAVVAPLSTPLWVQLFKAPVDPVALASRRGVVLAAF